MSINTRAARHCPSPALPVPGPVVITTRYRAVCFPTYTDHPQEMGLGAWRWSHWPAGAGAMHPSLAGPPLALLPTHACCSAHKDGPDPLPAQEVSEPSSALGAVGTVPLVMLSPGLLGIRAPAWGPAVPAVMLLSPAVEQTTTAQTPHVYCHPQFVREEVGTAGHSAQGLRGRSASRQSSSWHRPASFLAVGLWLPFLLAVGQRPLLGPGVQWS